MIKKFEVFLYIQVDIWMYRTRIQRRALGYEKVLYFEIIWSVEMLTNIKRVED